MESNTGTGIALNVTRTRVTVLVFNLTIISLMLSMIVARGGTAEQHIMLHLTSYAAHHIYELNARLTWHIVLRNARLHEGPK